MSKLQTRTSPFLRFAALSLAGVLSAGSLVTAQPAAADASFALSETVDVGALSRSIDVSGQRAYLPVDRDEDGGALTWLDLDGNVPAETEIDLSVPAPEDVLASADGQRIYVLHAKSGQLSIVDSDSQKVTKTIDGLPTWAGGLVEDTDTGLIYVFSDDGLVRVDPDTAEVSNPVAVSDEAYPLVKDAVYDASNHMIWVAEGRKSVVTGYSTIAGQWIETLAIPVGDYQVDGARFGGRPAGLAYDEELGEVHVLVQPTLRDDWSKNRVLSFRTEDAKYVGVPIEVGENAYTIAVNPTTHEIYTADGFSNTVSAISPENWTSSTAVDFGAEGVTEGTGSGNADTWGLDISDDGDKFYVTHPYTGRVSVVDRNGDLPLPTSRPVAPGQDDANEPEPPQENWEGPAAPKASDAPTGAQAAQAGELSWSVNDYMRAWEPRPLGDAKREGEEFVFDSASGWWDDAADTADVVWTGGVLIQHYPTLAPTVETTIGNPRLQITEDGSGSLSVDTAWELDDTQRSEGYTRTTIATFSEAEIGVEGETVTLNATPDFAGRPYTLDGEEFPDSYPAEFIDALDPQMRRWWMTTGASMDAEKVPNPFTVELALEEADQSADTDADSEVGTAADVEGDDAAGGSNQESDSDSSVTDDSLGGADSADSADSADGAGGADSADGGDGSKADSQGEDSTAGTGSQSGASDAGSSSTGGSDASVQPPREDAEAGGFLPRTGADPLLMLSLALGLGVVGFLLVIFGRRKRASDRRIG